MTTIVFSLSERKIINQEFKILMTVQNLEISFLSSLDPKITYKFSRITDWKKTLSFSIKFNLIIIDILNKDLKANLH